MATRVPILNRRRFLTLAGTAFAASPALAAPDLTGISTASMRGAIDASDFGVAPRALDDQSRAFDRMLKKASDQDIPVFLPAGIYMVSNLTLPRNVRLSGVPGATRIVYGGDGHLFAGDRTERFRLSGLTIDGANRGLREEAGALVDLAGTTDLAIDDCDFVGSARSGIALERCTGRVERSRISGAAEYAIYSVEASGMQIVGNAVADCGNGGILVHRWQAAADGTIVSGNRVARIAARKGGTGQYGNGINVYRAGNVMVSGNSVSGCAFSAIRANSGGNVQISSNSCLGSGETAIYSEFAFEGAVIVGNVVDGAANGISIVNFDRGGRLAVCSGNLVRNLSTKGPYPADPPGFGVGITAEADCSVTGNIVEHAPRYGLHLGWGPYLRNVVATGNVIRNAPEGIAVSVVEGAGPAVISDNVIEGASRGAIVGHRWTEAVTNDLARGASGYAHLTVERNRVS